ncbi:MAG: gliding motility-associated C-terminal domain-containing protein [Bacteroidales bacterium]|nr:gliding motility-associated C-terminal domain-containing protein [Bacteroidales bacterium]
MSYKYIGRWLLLSIMLVASALSYARNERDTLGAGTMVLFTENLGQWDSRVNYAVQLHGAALFLESDGITVALREETGHPGAGVLAAEKGKAKAVRGASAADGVRCHAYRMHFPGATPTLPSGRDRQEGYANYYLGNDPGRWRSHVASYAAARYDGLYPGVALEVYGGKNALKYNFIVDAGADASAIAIVYEGVDGVSVSREGNLVVRTSVRDVVELKPYVYQRSEVGGKRFENEEVESRWVVEGDVVRIALGKYDHSRELVIDPVLIFSTYTGSTADNWGTTAAYDSEKNVYTAGLVFGMGYPTSLGAYQDTAGSSVDVGIFKFDSLGQQRLYATYLGGSSADMPHSLFVNTFDELIVLGTTGSTDFPTTAGAYQEYHAGGQQIDYESSAIRYAAGSDLFVSRLSANGSQLQASTYIGGNGNDGLNFHNRFNLDYNVLMMGNDSLYYNYGDGARGELITDNLNNVYVGSTTMSTDFPTTTGSVQPTAPAGQNGVVFKLDHNLRTLLWSTYLGGNKDDAVYSIDVDSSYNLLVCGGTNSANFPTTEGAWQTAYGGGSADGFVCKISYNGDRLMASTYVGNRFYDQLYFVRAGKRNEVFLFGQTEPMGNSGFIYNAGYSVYNSGMLLMRMLPDLSDRVWSTVFGSPGRINLSPTAFAADICNRIYLAGWGRDFVGYSGISWYTVGTTGMETTANAWMDTTDGQDFYLMSIDANANQLEYATFFGETHIAGQPRGGGDHVDGGTSRFDRLATLYQSVCGSCGGTQGFPTTANAWSDSNLSSNCNNALFRFNVTNDFPVAEFIPPTAGCAPYTVNFRNTGRGTAYHWDFGDGTSSTLKNPTHTYSEGGIYTVTLIATMPGGCAEADTQRHTLHVIGDGGYSFAPLIACANSRIQIGMQPQIGATYHWFNENVSDQTVANPWVNETGTYLLQVSAPGCSEMDTFEVVNYSLISRCSAGLISCHDSADGTITLQLGAGIDPDSINIVLTPTATGSYIGRNYVVNGLAAGRYHVEVSGYGCIYEEDVTLQNPSRPAYRKEALDVLCNDSCTGWYSIAYQDGGQERDTLVGGLCAGTYITELTSDGCPLTDTTVIRRSHQLDGFHAWADRSSIYVGQTITLYSTEIAGATYRWSPSTDLETPSAASTRTTPLDTVVCYVVEATSADGCKATDTVCIHCTALHCGDPDYHIPNAFTPNNDGVNDEVDFSSPILTEVHVAIFNRWGQCIYESDDVNNCRWNGFYNGNACLPGVYTYTCRIRCHNGIETELKGDITLIL